MKNTSNKTAVKAVQVHRPPTDVASQAGQEDGLGGRVMYYGRAIRICRAARDMSMADLAKQTGLSASFISLVESEKRSMAPATLSAIGKELGAPMALLDMLATDGPVDELALGRAIITLLTTPEPS
jgi:ribosome-binding protein aMBF1 (putative translation factor)